MTQTLEELNKNFLVENISEYIYTLNEKKIIFTNDVIINGITIDNVCSTDDNTIVNGYDANNDRLVTYSINELNSIALSILAVEISKVKENYFRWKIEEYNNHELTNSEESKVKFGTKNSAKLSMKANALSILENIDGVFGKKHNAVKTIFYDEMISIKCDDKEIKLFILTY